MDIEAIVKKHLRRNGWSFSHDGECADAIRAALTELAEGYEQKQALLLDAHCERVNLLQERIRQLSETHAIELRAYEATVENLEQRILGLEGGLDEAK